MAPEDQETMAPEDQETMAPEVEMSVSWPEWPFDPMTAQASWSPSSFSTTSLTSEQIAVLREGTSVFRAWPPGETVSGGVHAGRQSEARAITNVNGVVLFQARENFKEVTYGTTAFLGYGGILENSWFLASHETFLVQDYPEDGSHIYPERYFTRNSLSSDIADFDINAHWRGAMTGIVGDNLGEGDWFDEIYQVHNPRFVHGEALITVRSIVDPRNSFNADVTFKNIRNTVTEQDYPDMTWAASIFVYTVDDYNYANLSSIDPRPGYGRTLRGRFGGPDFEEVVGGFSRRSAAETEVRAGSFGARRTVCPDNPCSH